MKWGTINVLSVTIVIRTTFAGEMVIIGSKCLGDDESKKVKEEKKNRTEFTKRYQKSNHGNQQWRMREYKKDFMNSNHEATLKYSVYNVVANGWLNIEDDEYTLYWVKVKISLSAHMFNNK